jgi:hypothetical protein
MYDFISWDNLAVTNKFHISITICRPGFYIFTSDCLVHRFDYTEEPEASLCEVPISTKDVMSAKTIQLPRSLSCIDYHQRHSLFVLVGDSNVSFSSNSYSGMLIH